MSCRCPSVSINSAWFDDRQSRVLDGSEEEEGRVNTPLFLIVGAGFCLQEIATKIMTQARTENQYWKGLPERAKGYSGRQGNGDCLHNTWHGLKALCDRSGTETVEC